MLLYVFYLARYIVHYMDWCTISTISIEFGGIPFTVPVSVADGPVNNSTGVPYIYIAPVSPSSKDLQKNASSSFSFSEAMSDYCSRNNYIAEDPRCARLTLLGKVYVLPYTAFLIINKILDAFIFRYT